VDEIWAYLQEKGFHPESPQDASWGERYFHMPDPDGHELSLRVHCDLRRFSPERWSLRNEAAKVVKGRE
jgi:hypothetical protein